MENSYRFTAEDIKLVEKFIEIRNKGYYADGKQVTDVHNRILGTNLNPTNCGSCIRNRISALETALNAFKKVVEEAENKAEDEKPKKKNVKKKEE